MFKFLEDLSLFYFFYYLAAFSEYLFLFCFLYLPLQFRISIIIPIFIPFFIFRISIFIPYFYPFLFLENLYLFHHFNIFPSHAQWNTTSYLCVYFLIIHRGFLPFSLHAFYQQWIPALLQFDRITHPYNPFSLLHPFVFPIMYFFVIITFGI